MKIQFRQTGGFAGLAKSAEIDTDQVAQEEAETVQSLVEQCAFWEVPSPASRSLPDQEQYSITIEAEGRSRTMHLGRSNLPTDLKPLVNYLTKKATYEKRK